MLTMCSIPSHTVADRRCRKIHSLDSFIWDDRFAARLSFERVRGFAAASRPTDVTAAADTSLWPGAAATAYRPRPQVGSQPQSREARD
jgi:hypothetical protein